MSPCHVTTSCVSVLVVVLTWTMAEGGRQARVRETASVPRRASSCAACPRDASPSSTAPTATSNSPPSLSPATHPSPVRCKYHTSSTPTPLSPVRCKYQISSTPTPLSPARCISTTPVLRHLHNQCPGVESVASSVSWS